MENKPITINVTVDDVIFRKFAVFDSLFRKRIWVLPLIFASIMSAFALACFAMRGNADQAAMIGSVLLVIGLGLPAAHILAFFRSVKTQIKAMGLERPRPVYSLSLSGEPDGARVTNIDKPAQYEWDGLFGAYRVSGCTYLYVEANKAFLLPDAQVEEGAEALWSLLSDMLPAEKLHDCRKTKDKQ
ncbi:MAG: hypothetical protein FWF87_05615 [Synergistaceae bacterium]|nr:hypothetical protein [Synergistaceae bacterium]